MGENQNKNLAKLKVEICPFSTLHRFPNSVEVQCSGSTLIGKLQAKYKNFDWMI